MNTSKDRMSITNSDYKKITSALDQVQDNGRDIRQIFQGYYDDSSDSQMEWEVDAAVIAFSMFSSRWTTEILSALYIAGDKRFNELRIPVYAEMILGLPGETYKSWTEGLGSLVDTSINNQIIQQQGEKQKIK